MATVRLEAPEEVLEGFLEERRRRGEDRWDEAWEGVLHMVPSPTKEHQALAGRLMIVLGPLALARGLEPAQDLELHKPGSHREDYKIPDLLFYRMPQPKNVESAEVVIEILSPGDETYRKVPWYHSLGVREVFVINPETRMPELFLSDGSVTKVAVRSSILAVTLEVTPGPKLHLTWQGGDASI